MITITQKIHIFFWKICGDVLYVFHVIVTVLLKIKIAVNDIVSSARTYINKLTFQYLEYFKYLSAILFKAGSGSDFAFALIKIDHKNKDYKTLAPPGH